MSSTEATQLYGQEHVRRYRETDGEVGHDWKEGATILLLTTTGRRSEGRHHVRPGSVARGQGQEDVIERGAAQGEIIDDDARLLDAPCGRQQSGHGIARRQREPLPARVSDRLRGAQAAQDPTQPLEVNAGTGPQLENVCADALL